VRMPELRRMRGELCGALIHEGRCVLDRRLRSTSLNVVGRHAGHSAGSYGPIPFAEREFDHLIRNVITIVGSNTFEKWDDNVRIILHREQANDLVSRGA
jgi:hypothetical protein